MTVFSTARKNSPASARKLLWFGPDWKLSSRVKLVKDSLHLAEHNPSCRAFRGGDLRDSPGRHLGLDRPPPPSQACPRAASLGWTRFDAPLRFWRTRMRQHTESRVNLVRSACTAVSRASVKFRGLEPDRRSATLGARLGLGRHAPASLSASFQLRLLDARRQTGQGGGRTRSLAHRLTEPRRQQSGLPLQVHSTVSSAIDSPQFFP
jgi:hypothetical protein